MSGEEHVVNIPSNGLDAFDTEIGATPETPVSAASLLELVPAYPEPVRGRAASITGTTIRRGGGRIRHDRPPVIRLAVAGIPRWARRVPIVPVLAAAFTLTAVVSVGASMLLLSQLPAQRQAHRAQEPDRSIAPTKVRTAPAPLNR